jgi:ABC-type transporter Mla MlaB component
MTGKCTNPLRRCQAVAVALARDVAAIDPLDDDQAEHLDSAGVALLCIVESLKRAELGLPRREVPANE